MLVQAKSFAMTALMNKETMTALVASAVISFVIFGVTLALTN